MRNADVGLDLICGSFFFFYTFIFLFISKFQLSVIIFYDFLGYNDNSNGCTQSWAPSDPLFFYFIAEARVRLSTGATVRGAREVNMYEARMFKWDVCGSEQRKLEQCCTHTLVRHRTREFFLSVFIYQSKFIISTTPDTFSNNESSTR